MTCSFANKLDENEIDFTDYLPTSPRDIEMLWRTLADFVASLRNPHLKALLQAFFTDDEIATAFKAAVSETAKAKAPAATKQ